MKKLIYLFVLLTVGLSAKAQVLGSDFETVVAAGKQDASTLMGAYINPAMEGLIFAMNGGWYHTAKTHKKFGFDISLAVNASMVSSDKENFNITDFDYEGTVVATPGTTPTVMGSGDPATITYVTSDGAETVEFEMPEGIKDDLPLNAVPAPTLQATVGLFYDTDVSLRYTPKVGDESVKGQLYGVGLKHNLMQYFGPLDKLPLNVAIMAGYTNMTVDYDIEDGSTFDGSNQRAEFSLDSYTVQAVASLDFPFVTLYGGLGYAGGKSSLGVLGTYVVEYNGGETETIVDPISLSYNPGGVRANLGASLNLAFFHIFADYTIQDYSNLTAGVAFSFR
ncbi:MAG: hypothetical protein CL868_18560 [Cytophagaceae bacterium]|nr:hypothetical protein [Cytophagaceae bacterium]